MKRTGVRDALVPVVLAAAALLLHGYHFGIEDQTLYVPAIKKHLDPALFPYDSPFFLTQARFTLFDEFMAWVVRASHLPLDAAMFLGHVAALLVMLTACRRLLRHCFEDRWAEWCGLALLIILLPVPVAGTRLGVMEQYFHPRGLAIALAVLAFLAAIERRPIAVLWLGIATAMHPLTGLWSIVHISFQTPWRHVRSVALVTMALGVAFCTPVAQPPPESNTQYWRDALSPAIFDVRYPLHWPWYEWLGVIAPLAMLAYFAVNGRRRGAARFADVSGRLMASASLGVLVALAVTAVPNRQLPLQPMRELHLVYIVMLVFIGARIEERFVRHRPLRRLGLFASIAATVLIAQRHFPASPHIEWPGRVPGNAWVEAFDWARQHTATDALFAIDPFYLRRPGPDSHSFRVFAERSMLSEAVHDLAPASMSPALTERWMNEQRALAGWPHFTREDFARLRREYGVSWVIVERPSRRNLNCPYANDAAAVCRVE